MRRFYNERWVFPQIASSNSCLEYKSCYFILKKGSYKQENVNRLLLFDVKRECENGGCEEVWVATYFFFRFSFL